MLRAMELEEPQEVVIVVPLETEVPQQVPTPVEVPAEVGAPGEDGWADDESASAATLRLMWEGSARSWL